MYLPVVVVEPQESMSPKYNNFVVMFLSLLNLLSTTTTFVADVATDAADVVAAFDATVATVVAAFAASVAAVAAAIAIAIVDLNSFPQQTQRHPKFPAKVLNLLEALPTPNMKHDCDSWKARVYGGRDSW